jgi:hypothetical protein
MYTNDIIQRALLYYLHLNVQGAALQNRTSRFRSQRELTLFIHRQTPAIYLFPVHVI